MAGETTLIFNGSLDFLPVIKFASKTQIVAVLWKEISNARYHPKYT